MHSPLNTRDGRSASMDQPSSVAKPDSGVLGLRRRLGTESDAIQGTTSSSSSSSLMSPRGTAAAPVAPSTLKTAQAHSVPNLHLSLSPPSTKVKSPLAPTKTALNVPQDIVPSTIKLLSELEKSWAMFSAKWKVVELFAGMQIWQEQHAEGDAEPLNGMLVSTITATLVAFIAGSIGGGGVVVASLLAGLIAFGTFWTRSAARMKRGVPCFKTSRVIDGSPSEIFLYLMDVKNFPTWDASIERASVIHTIDNHSDIIHIVYRPVWMWPIWVTPRDLCLLRYWRRTTDGSYVICMQSAVHPECPATHALVRAKCNGGGFVVAPRNIGVTHTDELSSLVTHVVHLDPVGWEGQLLQRFDALFSYMRPHIVALTGLQEVMEARKYVCPNVPEEFSSVLATAEAGSGPGINSEGGIGGADAGVGAAYGALQEFECSVPRAMWAEPDGGTMLVRGPDYLSDRRKVPSAPPVFRLVGVDLFRSSVAFEHIASRPDNVVQREIQRHEQAGTDMPFTFVINFVIPGNPRLSLVLYYQAPHPSVLDDGSPFADLMSEFIEGTDEFRNERFKLIPCIVEGSFIVRQAVGSTPAIIGKKLRQPYYRGKHYFELDVDISSSAVANRVVGLVTGYTKKLVIDMGFLLEGQRQDELPERLFGSCRLVHLDLDVAKQLD
ncbi:TPA: hypothetical protein N0F65_007914 [Lagenidium giganteum]|uniref:START domain-containing protein n=1 Tax=Lagenidium giganteum TaxID=4803 RepID=A0AAV2Z3F5_9STRA|nr:TPA: hypothetical protein N0F65_007914 [Lagenidium giganteum]